MPRRLLDRGAYRIFTESLVFRYFVFSRVQPKIKHKGTDRSKVSHCLGIPLSIPSESDQAPRRGWRGS